MIYSLFSITMIDHVENVTSEDGESSTEVVVKIPSDEKILIMESESLGDIDQFLTNDTTGRTFSTEKFDGVYSSVLT